MKKNILVSITLMVFALSTFSFAEDTTIKTQLRTKTRLQSSGNQQSATCLSTTATKLRDGSGAATAPGKKFGRGK